MCFNMSLHYESPNGSRTSRQTALGGTILHMSLHYESPSGSKTSRQTALCRFFNMSLHCESPNGSRTSHRMALGEDSVLLRYMLNALHRRWTPLDLSSNGTSCEERRSGAWGWQKPCLRGRISTQASSVWRFTLSDKSSTEPTSLSR